MAINDPKPHIGNIERFSSNQEYKYPTKLNVPFPTASRNRSQHGNRLLRQLETVRQQFQLNKDADVDLPANIIRDDALYVTFTSEWGFSLKFEQLHQNTDRPTYQIVNISKEQNPQDENLFRYHVAVMLTKGGVRHFIKRVKLYITENTKYKGEITDNPVANDLMANIDVIQMATLQAFWSDAPEIPFPENDKEVWWEVWFRKTSSDEKAMQKAEEYVKEIGGIVGVAKLEFPGHHIRLVKASADQLSKSVFLLDNLAELRAPQETADFVFNRSEESEDAKEWLDDLIARTENLTADNSVIITLLDSGVNNQHALLKGFLPDNRLYTWNSSWGKFDDYPQEGHGTGMAGLALYGDLVSALSSPSPIKLYHGLESFKILSPGTEIDPELYGTVYETACSTPIVDHPDNLRIFCLTITNKHFVFNGRPSSSSASIDKIAFGNVLDPKDPQLILVSGGNVEINKPEDYPDKNFYQSIDDPGQAYNAITVGSYTRKDRVIDEKQPHLKPIAPHGGMSPSNSTSATWETKWPNKPDVVMEGGNLADDGLGTVNHPSLLPLSIDKEFPKHIFTPFGNTSGATALASKMAAELQQEYPNAWPETIRGLMVHSADWTKAMKSEFDLSKEPGRRALLRSVGYGVPNLNRARYSMQNTVTMISETSIQPYRKEKSAPRYNHFHLYELPWPTDVLLNEIGEKDVTLKVTLSYFIEPNPGKRQYASNFRYHSHELDFKLIKPLETEQVFRRRISAASAGTEENEDDSVNTTSEVWTLKRVRSKGSIKKDFITTSGVELSRRNLLAIYPKNGWYRTLKRLNKIDEIVRYSLIVSIETPEQEIDLYTTVFNLVDVKIPLTIV